MKIGDINKYKLSGAKVEVHNLVPGSRVSCVAFTIGSAEAFLRGYEAGYDNFVIDAIGCTRNDPDFNCNAPYPIPDMKIEVKADFGREVEEVDENGTVSFFSGVGRIYFMGIAAE